MNKVHIIPAFAVTILAVSASVAFADHGDPAPMPVHIEAHTTEAVMPIAAVTAYMPESATCRIEEGLGLGSRVPSVRCLQEKLIAEKFLTAIDTPTGYFGELTQSALSAWQSARGVPSTGYFGTLSRAAWNAHMSSATSSVPAMPVMGHAHAPTDVSKWPAIPSVTIEALPDALSGYNVHIVPVNFTFVPEKVNTAVTVNEGHAHIFIDGVKLGRVYSNWIHVPREAFKTLGTHEVVITLNAHDHSDLTHNGARIEARTTVHIR